MQISYAAESAARDLDGSDVGIDGEAVPGSGPLRHELRTNLAVVGFSLGLCVVVAVGLSLLMTLLG